MIRQIYFDHAAATPISDEVLVAMQPYFQVQFYNPSAGYLPARQAKIALENARKTAASCLGARPAEITFTAGGSEANNLAIHGVMDTYPGSNLVISAVEHESIKETARQYDCKEIPVSPGGIADLTKLPDLIDDKTVLISVMYANNEIGTIQPLRKIAGIIKQIRQDRVARGVKLPLLFHSDAAQAANYLDLHVSRIGVDLLSLNGSKIYGPKQSGALYAKAGTRLEPLIYGGGQEHGLRSGTESLTGAVGFATALLAAQTIRREESARLTKLQHEFFKKVKAALPSTEINGTTTSRLPNNMHLTFPGVDNERLLLLLEESGVLAAAGSACSASNDEPSYVLKAIGLSDKQAQSSIRLTTGRSTTSADIDYLLDCIIKIVS